MQTDNYVFRVTELFERVVMRSLSWFSLSKYARCLFQSNKFSIEYNYG